MTKISILPNKVWKVAVETAKTYPCFGSIALGNIAEDNEKGVEVRMRYGDEFESDTVCIYVFHNGNVIYEKGTNSADECEKTVRDVLKKYLSYSDDEDDDDDDCEEIVELDDDEIEDVIIEREEELDQAVMDFLATVLGEAFYDLDADSSGELIEDCKDHFIEYIARKYSFTEIFRPMYLEEEDGTEFYTDTPYDEMEYDDEDNPIYM